jgi:hypothetical protein
MPPMRTFQYSARAVDPTTLVALSNIATQRNNVTEDTMTAVTQLLNYVATHPTP